MQQLYNAPEGCTVFDLVLQVYLSLNLLPKFLIDNNLKDLDLLTGVGESFIYDDDFIDDEFMKNEILKNGYKFCTGQLRPTSSNVIRSGFLLIENSQILKSESDKLFLI